MSRNRLSKSRCDEQNRDSINPAVGLHTPCVLTEIFLFRHLSLLDLCLVLVLDIPTSYFLISTFTILSLKAFIPATASITNLIVTTFDTIYFFLVFSYLLSSESGTLQQLLLVITVILSYHTYISRYVFLIKISPVVETS